MPKKPRARTRNQRLPCDHCGRLCRDPFNLSRHRLAVHLLGAIASGDIPAESFSVSTPPNKESPAKSPEGANSAEAAEAAANETEISLLEVAGNDSFERSLGSEEQNAPTAPLQPPDGTSDTGQTEQEAESSCLSLKSSSDLSIPEREGAGLAGYESNAEGADSGLMIVEEIPPSSITSSPEQSLELEDFDTADVPSEDDGWLCEQASGTAESREYSRSDGMASDPVPIPKAGTTELHQCEDCPYTSPWKPTLQRHMRGNHLFRKSRKAKAKCYFFCDGCSFATPGRRGMLAHFAAKHYSQDPDAYNLSLAPDGLAYHCEKCGYFTPLKHDLARHIRNRHLFCQLKKSKAKSRHSGKSFKPLAKRQPPLKEKKVKRKKKIKVDWFPCDSCSHNAASKDALARHYQSIHILQGTPKPRKRAEMSSLLE